MNKKLGETIKTVRTNKSLTAKKLCHQLLTPQQLSNIENGHQLPSAEKFILILSRLNIKYDEFIYLMDDDYLKSKLLMEKKLSEFVKRQSQDGLQSLSKEAQDSFNATDDIFFQHIHLMACAMNKLIETDYDYEAARPFLVPIKDYLDQFSNFNYYEITLIAQCLFIFDIESALILGKKALESIETLYHLYKNESDGCILLTNMAAYCLEYEDYWHLSLKYSQLSNALAANADDATKAIYSQIITQAACYKLKNGLFNKRHLIALTKTFKLIGWEIKYQNLMKFLEKHGIPLT